MNTFGNKLVLCLILFFLLASLASARTYRWVDEDGNVHYSDRAPLINPEKGHQVLDEEARTLKSIEGRKSAQELEKERRAAEEKAERERRKREQQIEDRALLSTYGSVEEIDQLLLDRVTLIDSFVKVTRQKLDKVNQDLEEARQRKVRMEESGKEVPEQLNKNISAYQKQIDNYQAQIDNNLSRRENIQEKFEKDRNRFLELQTDKARKKDASVERF